MFNLIFTISAQNSKTTNLRLELENLNYFKNDFLKSKI